MLPSIGTSKWGLLLAMSSATSTLNPQALIRLVPRQNRQTRALVFLAHTYTPTFSDMRRELYPSHELHRGVVLFWNVGS
jgi:hypothetical protein